MSLCVLSRGMHNIMSVHNLIGCPQKLKAMQMLKPNTKGTRIKYVVGTPWQHPNVRDRSDQNVFGSKGRAESGLKMGKVKTARE